MVCHTVFFITRRINDLYLETTITNVYDCNIQLHHKLQPAKKWSFVTMYYMHDMMIRYDTLIYMGLFSLSILDWL